MGSVFGSTAGYEAPPFQLLMASSAVEADQGSCPEASFFEVRRYQPAIIAYTEYTAAEGTSGAVRRIAGFIFGDNAQKTSVAMTVPVATTQQQIGDSVGAYVTSEPLSTTTTAAATTTTTAMQRMVFFMPSQYSLETLPRPNDGRVVVTTLPERTMAVLRYSGNGESQFAEKATALFTALAANTRVTSVSKAEAVLLQYNPPWTLPCATYQRSYGAH